MKKFINVTQISTLCPFRAKGALWWHKGVFASWGLPGGLRPPQSPSKIIHMWDCSSVQFALHTPVLSLLCANVCCCTQDRNAHVNYHTEAAHNLACNSLPSTYAITWPPFPASCRGFQTSHTCLKSSHIATFLLTTSIPGLAEQGDFHCPAPLPSPGPSPS